MIKTIFETAGDKFVDFCDRAIRSPRGDGFRPLKVAREAARAINDLFGQPVCSADERRHRRVERQKPVPPPPSLFRRNASTPPV